jgi:hypothetical protein
MPTASTNPPESRLSTEVKKIRVEPKIYFFIGFVAAMPLILGIGGIAGRQVNEQIIGVLGLFLAPAVFWYFCFQTIDIDCGVMTYRRPFFPVQRVPLSSVTEVRVVYSQGSEYISYRFVFFSGATTVCAFNPKLFALVDLSFVLEKVRAHSPSVCFDEATQGFLPASKKGGPEAATS